MEQSPPVGDKNSKSLQAELDLEKVLIVSLYYSIQTLMTFIKGKSGDAQSSIGRDESYEQEAAKRARGSSIISFNLIHPTLTLLLFRKRTRRSRRRTKPSRS